MGASICRDGAAQANTLCSSLGRKRPEMHQRELEGKYIHSVGGGENTKQPRAVSSSPRTLAPSEPPLLTETGGWLEDLEPQSSWDEAALCSLAVPAQGSSSEQFLFLSMVCRECSGEREGKRLSPLSIH